MHFRRAIVFLPLGLFAACGGATETGLFGEPGPNVSEAGQGTDTTTGDDSSSDDDSGTTGIIDSGGQSNKDSGPAIGSACDPSDSKSCPSGSYCNAPGCGSSGVCTATPSAESATLSPVCGCDNVTYWNESIAARRGISTKSSGTCSSPLPCGAAKKCAKDTYCNKGVNSAPSCNVGGNFGSCWGIPQTCPKDLYAYDCTSQKCDKAICALVKSERAYYSACKPN